MASLSSGNTAATVARISFGTPLGRQISIPGGGRQKPSQQGSARQLPTHVSSVVFTVNKRLCRHWILKKSKGTYRQLPHNRLSARWQSREAETPQQQQRERERGTSCCRSARRLCSPSKVEVGEVKLNSRHKSFIPMKLPRGKS
jgi:hypothetical protein